jgi:hypothetical protein
MRERTAVRCTTAEPAARSRHDWCGDEVLSENRLSANPLSVPGSAASEGRLPNGLGRPLKDHNVI